MNKATTITVRLSEEEKQQAQAKAGNFPLSVIIRAMLRMWINGEIEIKL